MTARLVLVRHGPSAYVHDLGPIDRAGMHRWRDAYDRAGIQSASEPPPALLQTAAAATHIVSSDLPRALASAERLARGRNIVSSPLLRETPLAIPQLPARWPLEIWNVAITLAWSYRMLRGTDTAADERARVVAATEWLGELVADGSSAVVVTHGAFRRLLSRQLVAAGWISSGRRGAYGHWSDWSFNARAQGVGLAAPTTSTPANSPVEQ